MFIFISSAFAQYYYSSGKEIPLLIDSSKILILSSDAGTYNSDDIIQDYNRLDSLYYEAGSIDGFDIYAIKGGYNLDAFIDTLMADIRIALVNPVYIISPDIPIYMGRTICCKFNPEVSRSFIDSLNEFYNVSIVYEREYTPNQFLLSVNEHSPLSTLEIANIYYNLAETEFSHPNFLGGYEFTGYRVYDHYWDLQWATNRAFEVSPIDSIINQKALQITCGDSNIIIAVIDQGISPHEDLPASRFVPGYDFEMMDNNPTPCEIPCCGWHGMSVAGIVGANHSLDSTASGDQNTGIYGMAPGCKIMPIKIGSGIPFDPPLKEPLNDNCWLNMTSDELVGSAISWAWANGADIISCSWLSKKHVDDIEFAVRQAAAAGRDGKGCGIFFAPGNNGRNFLDLDYCPVEMPEVITVGAIKPNDSIWDYSNYGKIDIVAPSGRSTLNPIWSLDIMDTLGYNNNYTGYGCGHEGEPNDIDYNCRFGGTSAAQPVAAGVGALVLSRRPDLTKIQLDSVIKFSADPNMYDTIVNPPDLKYGYGMVHPLRALLAVARGDVNNDKTINLLDVNYIINFLYRGGPEPIPSPLLADANCSGSSNLQDVSYIIDYLYRGGPRPSLCYKY
jgi:hypothetical protein